MMSSARANTLTPSWLTPDDRRQLTERSLPLGLAIFGIHLALYALTLWGAVGDFPRWVNIGSALASGLAIGLLFVLGHDTSHGSYVPGRRLNGVLTRLAFLPSLHSASLWDLYHNRIHHAFPNLKGYDCVWVPMSKAEFDTAGPLRRQFERIHRGLLGPLSYYLFGLWLAHLLFPWSKECRDNWRRHIFDSVFVVTAGAAMIAGIAWLGLALVPARPVWITLLQGWALPFVVLNYFMGFSIYLHHTHTKVPWFDDKAIWTAYKGALRCTVHTDFRVNVLPVWQMLMKHTAHHALPAIPVYRLSAAQDRLLGRYGDEVVRYCISGSRYFALVGACKLYDYERYCWTDFAGRPTSDPISVPARCAEADKSAMVSVSSGDP